MFGFDLPVVEGTSAFTSADAQGRYTISDRNVALSHIKGVVDTTTVSGNVTFNWKERLSIEGRLSTPSLDLDSYLPQRGDEEQGESARTLLPLAFLKDTDLRLTLLADQLRVFSTPFLQSSCSVTQQDGVLTSPFSLRLPGGGKASGHFTAALSADGKQAAIALKGLAPQINMLELCRQRGQKTLISGTGSADFDLHAQQRYWDDWKHTLGGVFSFMVKNGAILSPPSPAAREQGITENSATNFHTMAMSATVKDGVVSCNDFRILDTMLDVHGEGRVDLGNDTIDAHATITLAGIPEMPVEIKGKLFAPETNYKLLGAVTGTVGNIGSTLIDIVGTVITAPFKLLTGKKVLQP
jgi:AsmA protein